MRHLPDVDGLRAETDMPALGEILRRFRFHGVPGAPAPAGVPVDRGEELDAELLPVFSALESTQHLAADVVAAAARDAARHRADTLEHGRRLVAEARARASTARAEAAAVHLARAQAERDQVLAAAQTEADRIDRVAAERIPVLVDAVVRRVLALGEPAP